MKAKKKALISLNRLVSNLPMPAPERAWELRFVVADVREFSGKISMTATFPSVATSTLRQPIDSRKTDHNQSSWSTSGSKEAVVACLRTLEKPQGQHFLVYLLLLLNLKTSTRCLRQKYRNSEGRKKNCSSQPWCQNNLIGREISIQTEYWKPPQWDA